MKVSSFLEEGLGNSSYLIELGDGRAAAVDPSRDPAPYLAEAERRGWRISHVFETHLHADFVSGARELVHRGAHLVAPASAHLEHPHRPLGAGESLELGGWELRALGTPGHAPEHLSYLVLDDGRPQVLFSGGALLVGGLGRPDLLGPEWTEPLTRELFRSVQREILPLPDHLPVYPTHGGGSFCVAGGSQDRTTTIGRERAANPLLAIEEEEDFVRRLLAGLGSYPTYFTRLREVNRRGPVVYGSQPPILPPLDPETVAGLVDQGALVVDVRPARAYATDHLPGSISIPLREAFSSWLGWVVDPDQPLIFVLTEDQDPSEVIRRCLLIGYENLAGELVGGTERWRASGWPTAQTPVADPRELDGYLVVDVRQDDEYRAGHIPAAIPVELGRLDETAADLPGGPLVVHCAAGSRAVTAASLLERRGHRPRVMLAGVEEWAAATGRSLEIGQ